MADQQTPVPDAPTCGFAGLRDFAVEELERAREALLRAGEPRVVEFCIDDTQFVDGSAAHVRLMADVRGAAPGGETAIYYLHPADTNDEVGSVIHAFFSETKQPKDGRPRDNKRFSTTLYVGSSRTMWGRLREHLGFCSRSTYALKLKDWYPAKDLPLRLVCAIYPAGTSAMAIATLEDALWERLQPMFGRKGAR